MLYTISIEGKGGDVMTKYQLNFHSSHLHMHNQLREKCGIQRAVY